MTYSACRARHRGLYKFTALFSIKQPKNWGKLGIIPFPGMFLRKKTAVKSKSLPFPSSPEKTLEKG